jgi:hypothetical protein
MDYAWVKSLLYSCGLEILAELDDFIEFKGDVVDRNGNLFDLEGSMDLDQDTNAIHYSLNFFDAKKNYEYDAFIGTINEPTASDIIQLLQPDFIECA